MNPFDVLGIEPGSDKAAVRAAYRRIAQIYHPDRFAGADPEVRQEAERRMAEANRAYAELTGGRSQRRSWAPPPPPPPPPPAGDPFEEYFRSGAAGAAGTTTTTTTTAASASPPPTRPPVPRRLVDAALIAFVLTLAIVAVLARSSPSSSAAKPTHKPEAVTTACPESLVIAVQPFTYKRTPPSPTYRVTLTGTVANRSASLARLDVVTLRLMDDAGTVVHTAAAVPVVTELAAGQSTTWSADALVDGPHPPTRAHAELSFVLVTPPVACTAQS